MAAAFEVDLSGLDSVRERIAALAAGDLHQLLDTVGSEVASQTVLRITQTKSSPAGTPWRPWSARYARTRHAGHSLLEDTGRLVDSIQHLVDGAAVVVGSNMVYAAAHQYGTPRIPARPYLGLSDRDREEIETLAARYLAEVLSA